MSEVDVQGAEETQAGPLVELPPERPVTRRVDETAADMGTLIDMGHAEEQPEPPPPEPEP